MAVPAAVLDAIRSRTPEAHGFNQAVLGHPGSVIHDHCNWRAAIPFPVYFYRRSGCRYAVVHEIRQRGLE
jgi:hypothetical protein